MLIENSWATEKELKEIEKQIRSDIEKDVAKLLNDPEPTFEDMYSHVTLTRPYIRGVTHDLTQHDYQTSWALKSFKNWDELFNYFARNLFKTSDCLSRKQIQINLLWVDSFVEIKNISIAMR